MISCKLIFRNIKKNIRDYTVYYLTLMISVSLFYAFNSISGQAAFSEMGATKTLLFDQMDILISALSVVIAVVLAFLIIYANQFLLKRRKKELGIYMMSGMRKGRISRIFVGETFCVGVLALLSGLILGLAISQGLSLASLKMFAVELSDYQFVLSINALKQTVLYFVIIFIIVMLFNVRSVSSVKLIDLLTADRKNETIGTKNKILPLLLFLCSLALITASVMLFSKNGLLPSRENAWFQIAGGLLIAGTVVLFYSASTVIIGLIRASKARYLKGLTAFLVRQIDSKISTNFLVMSVVCGLLTITICAVSIGISIAVAMNQLSQSATPYDLNVLSNISVDGDSNIADYLKAQNVDMADYADAMVQISIYDADLTYGELFKGQDAALWQIDEALPETNISVISLSDYNKALTIQGKAPYTLADNEFLLNCNYEGTLAYIQTALLEHPQLTVAGVQLQRSSEEVLSSTYFMSSIGNNDRGTLIVPDTIAEQLVKANNVLLVQYKAGTNPDEVLQKMIPIGLDDTQGYRYAEKNMMYDMYYGTSALVTFLCCYIGLIFLIICATLLTLKQLTETTDNITRYGLLQKLGAKVEQINRTLLMQTLVFFAAPLTIAGLYSVFFMGQAIQIVETFLNIHVSTNVLFTVGMFLVVYGTYFLTAYLSCKRMIREQYSGRKEI